MKPVPAIVESQTEQLIAAVIEARNAITEAEEKAGKLEKQLASAREAAQMRRIELGKLLMRARQAYPKRGPRAKGWGEFLAKVGLEQSTAWRYMEIAGAPPEAGDDDAPGDVSCSENVVHENSSRNDLEQPEPEVVIDRDTWCTPKDLAHALGRWDLDPCSNDRSHIDAARTFRLDLGEDGLKLASSVTAKSRVFINPPYSDVRPWVDAYAHTRFCFLLKFDPSTKWFAALMKHTSFVLFPSGTRVEFEPPPGVPPEKSIANPFPHALFFARAADATAAIKAMCFPGWVINRG